jgi:hypothetical protein
MSKTATKKIDGKTYFVMKHTPLKSTRLLTKLMKVLGPSLGSLKGISSLKDVQNKAKDFQFEQGLAILTSICSSVESDAVEELINECLLSGSVSQDGTTIENIEVHFDDMIHMYKVVLFVLETNFKDYLKKLGISKAEGMTTTG